VQVKAGSEGGDFTRARYNIYYSKDLSLGTYNQSRKRTHRPGQTQKVTYIHLLVENSFDTKLMRALERDQEIVDTVLDSLAGLSPAERAKAEQESDAYREAMFMKNLFQELREK
jgi:SNF2 family DNA or RNA helicase